MFDRMEGSGDSAVVGHRVRCAGQVHCGLAMALLIGFSPLVTRAAAADTEPVTLTGRAILDHPAGKAIVAAGRLLKAGKAAEARKGAAKEVREEWAAMSSAEQKEEAARLQGRTPDPAAFEADIARVARWWSTGRAPGS